MDRDDVVPDLCPVIGLARDETAFCSSSFGLGVEPDGIVTSQRIDDLTVSSQTVGADQTFRRRVPLAYPSLDGSGEGIAGHVHPSQVSHLDRPYLFWREDGRHPEFDKLIAGELREELVLEPVDAEIAPHLEELQEIDRVFAGHVEARVSLLRFEGPIAASDVGEAEIGEESSSADG